MGSLNYQEARQLTSALRDGREYLEQSEHCSQCGDLTDIRDLNLGNLKCGRCYKSKMPTAKEIDAAILAVKIKYGYKEDL